MIGKFSVEEISAITEPIILLAERQEDLMIMAKRASRQVYSEFTGNTRLERINSAVRYFFIYLKMFKFK